MGKKIIEKIYLKVLYLEDSPMDFDLIRELLINAGYELNMDRAEKEKEFVSLLHSQKYDLILSDFKLPGFDAFKALQLANDICPAVPFICVSGSIGEETAIELIKQGAVDYILKDRLVKLPLAIKRALNEAKEKEALRLAEETLNQSEQTFRFLFENNPLCMLVYDLQTLSFLAVNNTAVNKYGYSQEEFLSMTIKDIRPAEDVQRLLNDLAKERPVLQHSGDWRHKLKDGTIIDVEITSHTIIFEGHKAAFVHALDITARKKAEKEIIASETRYRRLFEAAKDGILILDAETGKILDVNPFLIEILGYTYDMFIGKALWELGFFKDIAVNRDKFLELQRKKYVRYENLPLEASDGRQMAVEFVSNIYLVDNKKIIQCNIRDITKRRHAEEALIASENLFHTLARVSPVGIFKTNPDGYTTYVNPQWSQISGLSFENALGHGWLDAVHPEDKERLRTGWDKSVKENKTSYSEYRFLQSDGTITWVLGQATPEINSKNKTLGYIGTITDITKYRLAEESLRESEHAKSELLEKLNEAQNIAMIGSWEWDLKTDKVWWSDETYRIFGVTQQNFTPSFETNGKLIHPDDLEMYRKSFEHSFQTGELLDINIRLVPNDGLLKHCHVKGQLIYDASSQPVRFIGTLMDITERKLTEEALQESEERFSKAFRTSPYSLTISHLTNGKFIETNQAFTSIFGFTREETIADTSTGFNLWVDLEDRKQVVANLLAGNEVRDKEFLFKKKNGEIITCLFSAQLLKLNKDPYILVSINDITDRKRAEENILKLNRIYAVLSSINKTIVRIHEPDRLLTEACRIAIDEGKFRMAWIGMIDPQTNKLNVVASAGYTGNYLEKVNIDLNNEQRSNGPSGRAVKSGEHFISSNIEHDQNMLSWRTDALKYNYRSSAAFPIKVFEKVIGAFNLYSSEVNFFDENEIKLLDELTMDISFALEFIEREKQRKLAEESLRNSEEKYRNLIDNMSEGVFIANEKGAILFANNALARIHGFNSSDKFLEASTKGFMEFVEPSAREEVLKSFEKEIQSGKSTNEIEMPIVSANGSVVYILVRPSIITDGNQITGMSGIVRDITERKRIENELRKLSRAVEQSPASILITDLKGNIEYANPKVLEITGYRFDELIGRNPRILSSGETPSIEYKILWDTISSGKEWRGEFHNKKKNGELYWESASISPVINEKGKLIYYLAVKEDITDKKKMFLELMNAKEKAEEMNRLKSNFMANMSHELRTPLVGLLGISESMESELDGDSKENAKIIHESGLRLLNTLTDILNFSKVESEQVELNLSIVDIAKFLSIEIELYQISAAAKNIILKENFPTTNIQLQTDEKLLREIIDNLISNAIKFTPSGSITVSLQQKYNQVVIKISDTGIGIPIDKLDYIFEEFRQVSEGMSRNFEGTGLGLTIVKKYVHLLNGTISVESKVGLGSTFIVRLPITDFVLKPGIAKDNDASQNLDTIAFNNIQYSVLIVEDDLISEKVFKKMLAEDYVVFTTHTGLEAIELVKKHTIDVILMDINLRHDMSGIETTKIIRKIKGYENKPIVAMTAYAMLSDRDEFLRNGCSHYIAKPFRRNELLQLLDEILKPKI
jgi:PAS domain S-box-containing protein